MFAYSYSKYGGPEVLTKVELPTPSPGAGEVLVKVIATTVSTGDWRARSLTLPEGLGWVGRLVFGVFGPRKKVLGTDCAGRVENIGEDVTGFEIGDAVTGFVGARFGAHAEYVSVPAERLVPKPERLFRGSGCDPLRGHDGL